MTEALQKVETKMQGLGAKLTKFQAAYSMLTAVCVKLKGTTSMLPRKYNKQRNLLLCVRAGLGKTRVLTGATLALAELLKEKDDALVVFVVYTSETLMKQDEDQ